jgi:hypothetical protein
MSLSQDAAAQQADQYAMQDAFRRLSDNCFRKCVRRYEPDGDVTVGEGACLERCVHKWLDSYREIGVHMQKVCAKICICAFMLFNFMFV